VHHQSPEFLLPESGIAEHKKQSLLPLKSWYDVESLQHPDWEHPGFVNISE
jgi:hypothetical protein